MALHEPVLMEKASKTAHVELQLGSGEDVRQPRVKVDFKRASFCLHCLHAVDPSCAALGAVAGDAIVSRYEPDEENFGREARNGVAVGFEEDAQAEVCGQEAVAVGQRSGRTGDAERAPQSSFGVRVDMDAQVTGSIIPRTEARYVFKTGESSWERQTCREEMGKQDQERTYPHVCTLMLMNDFNESTLCQYLLMKSAGMRDQPDLGSRYNRVYSSCELRRKKRNRHSEDLSRYLGSGIYEALVSLGAGVRTVWTARLHSLFNRLYIRHVAGSSN